MRRQENPTHEIPSFARYLNQVFGFRAAAGRLTDARHDPDISPQSVFLAAFYGFVFRLPSFQQLESDLAQPQLQRWIGSERGFGDDVLRYSLCGFDVAGLEQMLVQVNRALSGARPWMKAACKAASSPPWMVSKYCPATAGVATPAWNVAFPRAREA